MYGRKWHRIRTHASRQLFLNIMSCFLKHFAYILRDLFEFHSLVSKQKSSEASSEFYFNLLPRTSRTFFVPSCNIFSVSFECNSGKTNDKFITSWSSFLSSDTVTTSSKRKRRNYCIQVFGHSLWSAISCQRKWLRIPISNVVLWHSRELYFT